MSRAWLLAPAIALLMAACGGGASTPARSSTSPPPSAGRLSLSPAAPTPNSRVTFSFTATAGSGRRGSSVVSFGLEIAGPRRRGCLGPRAAAVGHVLKGETASVRLGGPWCVGQYSGQVQEFSRPYCQPGQMCPQYVRLVATVARTTFQVTAT